MLLKRPISTTFPTAREVRHKLGDALRDVELLRGLLRLAERAERYRERDVEENIEEFPNCGYRTTTRKGRRAS